MSDEVSSRFTAVASDPHAVIRMLLEGMVLLERDTEAGERLIAIVCSKDQLDASGTRVRDREMVRRLLANPTIARSYVGAQPQTDYAMDGTPSVTFDTVYSAAGQGVDYPQVGQAKLFVACSGADRPRPVELRKNGRGEWKVTSWSSLTVGVRKGATAAGDF
jgi:hypothetical protein